MKQTITTKTDVVIDAEKMEYNVLYRGIGSSRYLFLKIRIIPENKDMPNFIILSFAEGKQCVAQRNISGELILEPNGTTVAFTQDILPAEVDTEETD